MGNDVENNMHTNKRPAKLIQQIAHSFLHVLTSNSYKLNACHLHLPIAAIVSTPFEQVNRRFRKAGFAVHCRRF